MTDKERAAAMNIFEELSDAMDTCPMNPTHIMMNPDKYRELKAATQLHKLYTFNTDDCKKVPNKALGMIILVSDGIDGIYCGKMKYDQLDERSGEDE